jgi:hypothetical protein
MNHKLRVLIYVLLVVVLALIATEEHPSLAEGSIIYVDADATGANNGASWTDAFTTLQPALDTAVAYDQVWVAAGTYLPTHEFIPGDPRSASFQMKNGVEIYGGFDPSTGITGWLDRDWVSNPAILSGDIGIGGDSSDNSYHVFYHNFIELDNSAILDGFVITAGNANGEIAPHGNGGGMYNDIYNGSPMITNCVFTNNNANIYGGGMYNTNHANPHLHDCSFLDNNAGFGGGGMANMNSMPTLGDCTFHSNYGEEGGGIFNSGSSPLLYNITFSENIAHSGGGMVNVSSNPHLENVTFSGNFASDGGAMSNYSSSPYLNNCTIVDNSVAEGGIGGGIYNSSGTPVLTLCILWGNAPDQIAGAEATVSLSDIQGGYAGIANIDADPLLSDLADHGGATLTYALWPGSPAIDSGYTDCSPRDQRYVHRPIDGDMDGYASCDMGSYEATLWLYLPIVTKSP